MALLQHEAHLHNSAVMRTGRCIGWGQDGYLGQDMATCKNSVAWQRKKKTIWSNSTTVTHFPPRPLNNLKQPRLLDIELSIDKPLTDLTRFLFWLQRMSTRKQNVSWNCPLQTIQEYKTKLLTFPNFLSVFHINYNKKTKQEDGLTL